MTPKQKVLKKYPKALALQSETMWWIRSESGLGGKVLSTYFDLVRRAWADAARRLK